MLILSTSLISAQQVTTPIDRVFLEPLSYLTSYLLLPELRHKPAFMLLKRHSITSKFSAWCGGCRVQVPAISTISIVE